VGDFGPSAAQIIERQAAMLAISFEHSDFFVRNLAALRVEERIDLAVYQPFAFCRGNFSVVAHGEAVRGVITIWWQEIRKPAALVGTGRYST
jgi:Phage capsid family